MGEWTTADDAALREYVIWDTGGAEGIVPSELCQRAAAHIRALEAERDALRAELEEAKRVVPAILRTALNAGTAMGSHLSLDHFRFAKSWGLL